MYSHGNTIKILKKYFEFRECFRNIRVFPKYSRHSRHFCRNIMGNLQEYCGNTEKFLRKCCNIHRIGRNISGIFWEFYSIPTLFLKYSRSIPTGIPSKYCKNTSRFGNISGIPKYSRNIPGIPGLFVGI